MPSQEPLSPHMLDFVSHSAGQTRRLGVRLGRLLQAGDVLLLAGEYGAGKTTFIQGLAEGLGVAGPVTSPSFTLIWEYCATSEHGELPFYHIDLYRLRTPEEALALGLEEYLDGAGVCAVEWADRFPEIMPVANLLIELAFLSDTKRVVRLTPAGPHYELLVEHFKQNAFGR
jgi:tRNA threonylcarbamoyladenosine biosynthesis protein TsaE